MQKITADLSQLTSPFSDGTPANRVETGALEINDDWPGVFIRGDNAMYYAMNLQSLLNQFEKMEEQQDRPFVVAVLKGLLNTLQSCNTRGISNG